MDFDERLPGMMHSVREIIEEAEKALIEAEKSCVCARKWLTNFTIARVNQELDGKDASNEQPSDSGD